MSILSRAIKLIAPSSTASGYSSKDLVRLEAKIGGTLFGSIPEGRRREFFCQDENTWVWYESFTDSVTNKTSALTTQYQIRGDQIIKIQDGQSQRYASPEETRNLVDAIERYHELIQKRIYAPILAS